VSRLVLLAIALLLGCSQPNQRGTRAEQMPDGNGSPPALAPRDASDVAVTPAPSAADAGAPADAPAAPDVVPADRSLPAEAAPLPPDAAPAAMPDAPPVDTAPPDATEPPPEERCQPPARSCSADQTATRRCDERGRWVFEQTCVDGTSCNAGECLCRPGLCEDSVVLRLATSIFGIAVGGDLLHYHKYNADAELSGLHRLNLRTGEAGTTVADARDNNLGHLAADSAGVLTWCRGQIEGGPPAAIMRGTAVLEAASCHELVVNDTHIYFTLDDGPGLFRRAIDRPGRQLVWDGSPMDFKLAGPYIYLSSFDDGEDAESISVHRVRVSGAAPGQPELVATATTFEDPSFYTIAVDEQHVFAIDADGLLWAPLTRGSTFSTFWRGAGPEVKGLTLTATHVYWSTETPGVSGCTAATVWRKPKALDAPAVPIATYPGACPSWELPLAGGFLYSVISSAVGGSQIVRLRP
jgi:hypothetical protein